MADILKGAPVAAAQMKELTLRINALKNNGIHPCLAIVRVGERDEDLSYERGAMQRAASLGIEAKRFLLSDKASEEQLLNVLQTINKDNHIHGCLLFRPLPAHLDTELVANTLCPEKDIDAMTTASMGGLLTRANIGFAPCTAAACIEILRYYNISVKGKKVAMIGKSATVGLPTALLLMNEDATVSVCHVLTDPEDTKRFCHNADIIISAAGCRNLIGPDYVKPGQVIIDVGINVTSEGKICGDVTFDQVEPIVSAITPVPGGVGAVTSTVMCRHVVEAACQMTQTEEKCERG